MNLNRIYKNINSQNSKRILYTKALTQHCKNPMQSTNSQNSSSKPTLHNTMQVI